MTPHPARIIRKLGVVETPAATAVSITALLQYVFLFRLWKGYPLRAIGDVIHPNVVIAGLSLSALGTAGIAIASFRMWVRGTAAARRLERPAINPSFDSIRQRLIILADRSTLPRAPELLYTSKNAEALEVRDDGANLNAVVVGLDQRKNERLDPGVFAAKLGHELSHLELGATRTEINVRRAVVLHFRVLTWLVCVFAIVIGFIDPRGIGSKPPYGGFDPVFDVQLYEALAAQFAALLLSSAIVFVYSYFFVVRREHVHDLRGVQLAASPAPATRIFAAAGQSNSSFSSLCDFFQLHPSAAARTKVILKRDFILLSVVVFPLIVGGIPGPLLQLLTAGWRTALGVEEQWWNLGLTVLGGVLFYFILSADLSRLGLSAALGRVSLAGGAIYALCAGFATQVPRIVLEIIFGWRHALAPIVVINRIAGGFWAGGGLITLMIALTLLALAYLSAIRIAALGEAGAGRAFWLDRSLGVIILTGVFTITSLTSSGFIIDVLELLAVVMLCRIVIVVWLPRCDVCGRRPLGALRLSTRCKCGGERLPYLRSLGFRQRSCQQVIVASD
jgi:hypothetical protein